MLKTHPQANMIIRKLRQAARTHNMPFARIVWEYARSQCAQHLLSQQSLQRHFLLTGSTLINAWLMTYLRLNHHLTVLMHHDWAFADMNMMRHEIWPQIKQACQLPTSAGLTFWPEKSSFIWQTTHFEPHFIGIMPITLANIPTALEIALIPSHQSHINGTLVTLWQPYQEAPPLTVKALPQPHFLAHALCTFLGSKDFQYKAIFDLACLLEHHPAELTTTLIHEVFQRRTQTLTAQMWQQQFEPDATALKWLNANYQSFCRQARIKQPPAFVEALARVGNWAKPFLSALTAPTTGNSKRH